MLPAAVLRGIGIGDAPLFCRINGIKKMKREEFIKRIWKPYMTIEYKHPRMKDSILCMLISIHFDDEVMELQPFKFSFMSY